MSQRMMTENIRRMDHMAVGRYQLAGVNGAQLPTAIDPEEDAGEGDDGPLRRIEVRLTDKEFGRFEALEG